MQQMNCNLAGNQMKKILALLLMFVSTTVFADVGLFFDGTARFARTGVIQAS